MKTTISVASDIVRTPRVMQVEGIFDVPPAQRSELSWEVELPVEQREWNVGLVVGPSGCGKSTLAKNLWPEEHARAYPWDPKRSLLDSFPEELGVKELVAVLSSVGFSSPPSWLRPFHVLSTGEQFRATMARIIAENRDGLAVVDEYTSVIDRVVARVGSTAIAKAVRRRNQKLVAVTCHEDVEPWLQPDWVYRPAEKTFAWRELQRRPPVELEVARVKTETWQIFRKHHYLTGDLNRTAKCFCAFVEGRPVAFHSYLPFVGKLRDSRKAVRGHRSVCLPDYQGVGIGNFLITFLAGAWAATGYRVFRNTGHPAEIAGAMRSKEWVCIRAPSMNAKDTGRFASSMAKTRAANRLTASFEYVGPRMELEQARQLVAGS